MSSAALADFASAVGTSDPVVAAGGQTQWEVGGLPGAAARVVRAPTGVVAHEPAEMIIRARAGTTLAELQSVAAGSGQFVAVEAADPDRATIGGVLSVGDAGLRQLGWGPVRDTVLEVTAVNYRGELFKTGAPLVKNVTGFDLARLLVGSLGTLALMAEVVLRCRPRPEVESWWVAEEVDPFAVFASLYRPLAVLWDGTRTWVGLTGFHVDVHDQARQVLTPMGSWQAVDGPPSGGPEPPGSAGSASPGDSAGPGGSGGSAVRCTFAELREWPKQAGANGEWLAELGVGLRGGLVHCSAPAAAAGRDGGAGRRGSTDPAVVALHREIKARFDPPGRLGPGRQVLAALDEVGPDEAGPGPLTAGDGVTTRTP